MKVNLDIVLPGNFSLSFRHSAFGCEAFEASPGLWTVRLPANEDTTLFKNIKNKISKCRILPVKADKAAETEAEISSIKETKGFVVMECLVKGRR